MHGQEEFSGMPESWRVVVWFQVPGWSLFMGQDFVALISDLWQSILSFPSFHLPNSPLVSCKEATHPWYEINISP